MEKQIGRVHRILQRWSGARATCASTEADFEHRTSPYAPMNLMLRFVTEAGPRTVIASGIPLNLAADIAREMKKAGHYAQFIDHLPNVSMAERVKRIKAEKHLATRRKHSTLSVVRDQGMAR